MAIGRAAAWIGIGGAGLYGAGSAILDDEGPYADMAETAFGDRRAVKAVIRSSAAAAFGPDGDITEEAYRRDDGTIGMRNHRHNYYHGRHVRTNTDSTMPIGSYMQGQVDGSVTMGLYNLRRGGY